MHDTLLDVPIIPTQCMYMTSKPCTHMHTLTTRGTNMKAQHKQCATTYQTLTAKPVFMADSTVSVMELIAAGHAVAWPHDAGGQALCGMARVTVTTGNKIDLTNTGSCKYDNTVHKEMPSQPIHRYRKHHPCEISCVYMRIISRSCTHMYTCASHTSSSSSLSLSLSLSRMYERRYAFSQTQTRGTCQ